VAEEGAQRPSRSPLAAIDCGTNTIKLLIGTLPSVAVRESIGHVPEIAGVSAGGMPTRVKCLHVLAGQALAQGPGVNPLGDEVLDLLGDF